MSHQDMNIFFGIAAIFVAVICLSAWFDKRRREALMRAAGSLGLTFTANPGDIFLGQVALFPLGNQGHSRGARNLMQGSYQGVPIAVFDYSYTIGHGKNRTTHRQTVLLISTEGRVRVPDFSVRPENILDKVATVFGCVDINFERDQAFSKAYRLHGRDEAAVRLLFGEGTRNFLIRNAGLYVEGAGCGMLLYRKDVCVDPAGLRFFLDRSFELFSLLAANAA